MSIATRLWALRTRYPLLVACAGVTVAILLIWPVVDFYLREAELVTPFGFNDFGAYWGALDRWSEGGQIYVQDESGGYHGSYLYPPVTLLLFYPFTGFEFTTGAILFGALSLVLLWVGLDAVARSLGCELGVGERLLLLPLLFSFQPALRDFKWAQMSTLLTALLCFAFYAQELGAGRDGQRVGASQDGQRARLYRYASGALTTLGSSFKLFFATSGAHLLRDRQRFAGAMVTAGALLFVSLAVFGIDTHRAYVDVLLWGKGWGATRPPDIWDTSAAYRPLYVLGGLAMPLRALGVLSVIGLTLAARHAEADAARHATFALGVAVVPLLAPQADSHDLVVVLLPAVILLAGELDAATGYPSIPVLSVLLFHLHRYVLEVAINPPEWLPLGTFVSSHAAWFQPGMWATFLLVGLAVYRVAEFASLPSSLGGSDESTSPNQ